MYLYTPPGRDCATLTTCLPTDLPHCPQPSNKTITDRSIRDERINSRMSLIAETVDDLRDYTTAELVAICIASMLSIICIASQLYCRLLQRKPNASTSLQSLHLHIPSANPAALPLPPPPAGLLTTSQNLEPCWRSPADAAASTRTRDMQTQTSDDMEQQPENNNNDDNTPSTSSEMRKYFERSALHLKDKRQL